MLNINFKNVFFFFTSACICSLILSILYFSRYTHYHMCIAPHKYLLFEIKQRVRVERQSGWQKEVARVRTRNV